MPDPHDNDHDLPEHKWHEQDLLEHLGQSGGNGLLANKMLWLAVAIAVVLVAALFFLFRGPAPVTSSDPSLAGGEICKMGEYHRTAGQNPEILDTYFRALDAGRYEEAQGIIQQQQVVLLEPNILISVLPDQDHDKYLKVKIPADGRYLYVIKKGVVCE